MGDLSPKIRAVYDDYLTSPLTTPSALRSLVHMHRSRADTETESRTNVDLKLVGYIAASCLALLDSWDDVGDSERRAIQAACLYFADTDDEESDFETIGGFDDDARVVNHVAKELGRADLLIPVGARRGFSGGFGSAS